MKLEIFDNKDYGTKNLRFSEIPSVNERNILKQNGYRFTTKYGGVWYPYSTVAKENNEDFVKEFSQKFYSVVEDEKEPEEKVVDKITQEEHEIKNVQLEDVLKDLLEQVKLQNEKIAQLEKKLEEKDKEISEKENIQDVQDKTTNV